MLKTIILILTAVIITSRLHALFIDYLHLFLMLSISISVSRDNPYAHLNTTANFLGCEDVGKRTVSGQSTYVANATLYCTQTYKKICLYIELPFFHYFPLLQIHSQTRIS